jgi:hypothetical protein
MFLFAQSNRKFDGSDELPAIPGRFSRQGASSVTGHDKAGFYIHGGEVHSLSGVFNLEYYGMDS